MPVDGNLKPLVNSFDDGLCFVNQTLHTFISHAAQGHAQLTFARRNAKRWRTEPHVRQGAEAKITI